MKVQGTLNYQLSMIVLGIFESNLVGSVSWEKAMLYIAGIRLVNFRSNLCKYIFRLWVDCWKHLSIKLPLISVLDISPAWRKQYNDFRNLQLYSAHSNFPVLSKGCSMLKSWSISPYKYALTISALSTIRFRGVDFAKTFVYYHVLSRERMGWLHLSRNETFAYHLSYNIYSWRWLQIQNQWYSYS